MPSATGSGPLTAPLPNGNADIRVDQTLAPLRNDALFGTV